MRRREYMLQIGLEGTIMALSPTLLILTFWGKSAASPSALTLILTAVAVTACWGCALTLLRYPRWGKILAAIVLAICYFLSGEKLLNNPFVALPGSILFIFSIFAITDFTIATSRHRSDHTGRCLQRAKWACLTVLPIAALAYIAPVSEAGIRLAVVLLSSVIAQTLLCHYLFAARAAAGLLWPLAAGLLVLGVWQFISSDLLPGILAVISGLTWLWLPHSQKISGKGEHWGESLLDHPARVLFTTFFLLCVFGTVLLLFPLATTQQTISVLDAAFTAVSAVCVTGLIVLDTPSDFSGFGQACILLLIQLGGLGIMTITTMALHALGRRLSLKQERLLTSMTDTNRLDLVAALTAILKVTFICEALGAAMLATTFYLAGDTGPAAVWRGLFTAVSAFCNAGFALQTDNLVSYQSMPVVLYTVSLLIILGGLAPATSLAVPRWLTGKTTPIPARLALVTSLLLLVLGTAAFLAFEWTGILNGMSFPDKLHNAWFQSVTLRTAGFNSVDLTHSTNVTVLIMLVFMFIGGSPGGTAGGVKTTTIAVVAMTFWATITSNNEVVTQHRRIHPTSIYRAITIVIAGVVLWFLVVLMLAVTQQIPSRELLFEATSAIGTAGLSLGATTKLDEVGKVIIMLAMFAGRIGPITLFMLLSNKQPVSDTRYPVESINIT